MKAGTIKLLAVAVSSLLLFTGCGSGNDSKVTGSGHKEVKIVTSFYPVYLAAINAAKDIPDVAVVNLTSPQQGCLHDYQLKTADLKIIEDADIFVVNGAGMESFVDKVIRQQPGLKIVDASKGIALLKDPFSREGNPHVWVSISGAIEQEKNVGSQLALLDPDNADKYKSNTEAYVKKLETLRTKMHQGLDAVKSRNIVTFHEAFPYFAAEFNLNIAAVIEQDPGSEPEAGELARTVDTVRRENVKALFTEPQYLSSAAEVIAKETGAKVYILDPVVTGEAVGDTDAYIKTMEANLKTLEEALNQ